MNKALVLTGLLLAAPAPPRAQEASQTLCQFIETADNSREFPTFLKRCPVGAVVDVTLQTPLIIQRMASSICDFGGTILVDGSRLACRYSGVRTPLAAQIPGRVPPTQ